LIRLQQRVDDWSDELPYVVAQYTAPALGRNCSVELMHPNLPVAEALAKPLRLATTAGTLANSTPRRTALDCVAISWLIRFRSFSSMPRISV
jgi:hypothetical protein